MPGTTGAVAQIVIFAEELLFGRKDVLAANLNLARGGKVVLTIMSATLLVKILIEKRDVAPKNIRLPSFAFLGSWRQPFCFLTPFVCRRRWPQLS